MTSERSIPHLRDVFSISGYTPHNNVQNDSVQHVEIKRQSKKRRDNNKTLTSGDVKTLERHLSMKKTIRKKIMRDLQQAFVDDPNEFSSDKMKTEIRTEAFNFDNNKTGAKSDNFLDMLRGDQRRVNDYCVNDINPQHRGYDYDTPVAHQNNEKQSFWRRLTGKNKTKR